MNAKLQKTPSDARQQSGVHKVVKIFIDSNHREDITRSQKERASNFADRFRTKTGDGPNTA